VSQIGFQLLKAGQAEDKAIKGGQEYGLGRDVGILAGIRQTGAGGAEIEDFVEIAGKRGDVVISFILLFYKRKKAAPTFCFLPGLGPLTPFVAAVVGAATTRD
jgi:hypothetical protein